MTLPFLLAANLILLTRLVCLFKDEPVSPRAWIWKTAVELGALCAFFHLTPASGGALLLVIVMNLAGARTERHARRRHLLRLLLGLVELAGLSLLLTPTTGVQLRAVWLGLDQHLANLTALAPLFKGAASPGAQWFLFGLLLSANEANLIIRTVFDRLDLKPRARPEGRGLIEAKGSVDLGEFNRGRVIGLLERALLYAFILQGQYGAIGFVMTAKAFARFKALDDRSFAEYVLIGTLLSGGLALLFGLIVLHASGA